MNQRSLMLHTLYKKYKEQLSVVPLPQNVAWSCLPANYYTVSENDVKCDEYIYHRICLASKQTG